MEKSFCKASIFLLVLILITGRLCPQDQTIKFEHITTEQGLASNTVYDIIQDRCGFMWFGTNDGLCR